MTLDDGARRSRHILLVDDDDSLLRTLRVNLTARGYRVTLARDAATGLAAARHEPPDLVVVDLGLPDQDGLHVIESLRSTLTRLRNHATAVRGAAVG